MSTAGGDVSVLAPWASYVLQDRELISGQNPFSDEALLKLLLAALNRRKDRFQRHKNRRETEGRRDVFHFSAKEISKRPVCPSFSQCEMTAEITRVDF